MYFIPAYFASATISAALNCVGLNCGANFSYSTTGTCFCSMYHSPADGTLYTPQWMNMPNLAFSNHSRALRFDSEGWYVCAVSGEFASVVRNTVAIKARNANRIFLMFSSDPRAG